MLLRCPTRSNRCPRASSRAPSRSYALRAGWTSQHRLVSVTLAEPPKDAVRAFRPGDACEREASAIVYEPASGETREILLSLTSGTVVSADVVEGVEPPVILSEVDEGIAAVKADPAFREALARRGIADVDLVHVELWPFGDLAPEEERSLRLVWTPVWVRHHADDNPYAHPVRGLHAVLDLRAMKVIRIEDDGETPIPEAPGNYTADAVGAFRDDVRPLEIVQPEGPSFELDGWALRWQKWQLRIGFNQREGLVLHELGYEDEGRVRPICYRASCAELVIPYGDAGSAGYRKNAFDIGEIGLGLADELARARLRLSRRDPVPRRRSRRSPRRGRHAAQRDLHPRGGRRPALEARRLADREGGGQAKPPPRRLVDRDRSTTTSTPSTGTCTRTGRSSSRSS